MKKRYESLSVSVLFLSMENPLLVGSPTEEIVIDNGSVTVEDLKPGFEGGDFMDITFD